MIKQIKTVSMPIAAIETQEYLFADTLTTIAANCIDFDERSFDAATVRRQIRESFRFQRFGVMNWLLQNGVSIPAALLSDDVHVSVGLQYPDR